MKPKVKLEFAPGCFDDLDLTQEEIDELVNEIQAMADSGELFEDAEELDEDEAEEIWQSLNRNIRQ